MSARSKAESRKREETAAAGFARRFKGWGDDGSLIEPGTETGDATVEDVVRAGTGGSRRGAARGMERSRT